MYFKLLLKAFANNVAIEKVWENSWSLSVYLKRQQPKQKKNSKEPFKTEGKIVKKL